LICALNLITECVVIRVNKCYFITLLFKSKRRERETSLGFFSRG
jgi:hypothetical protein